MRIPAARGMTFIDVIIGVFLVLVVFLALFGLLRLSILLSSLVKVRAAATAVAASQMEYIRTLPYDSVGTVGGIPAGPIPQNSTVTVNNVQYNVRTFVEYVDDPADGTGASDSNGIVTDYKRAKIAVTYSIKGSAYEVDLVSNIVPVSLETTNGGGTLQINVVNADGAAVPGASVHIQNPSTDPTVDVTTFSDSTGTVFLPGAATSTDYRVTVTKAGYSTATTYARDATNQNPTPGYLTVVQNQTTSGTFAVDALSTLAFSTFEAPSAGIFSDPFDTTASIASLSSAEESAGAIVLTAVSGNYPPSGSVSSISVAPTALSGWVNASSTMTLPAGTSILIHVLDGSGALVPDTALPGNAAGFSSSPIDLSSLATSTYPALALSADLLSSDASSTPALLSWAVGYQKGKTPLPNISFTLTGAKTIGSTGAGASILKTTIATTTDASGTRSLSLEWDAYALSISGYDASDACTAPPYAIAPGTSVVSALTLSPRTANSLLVSVYTNAGVSVPGASVTLSRTGFSSTVVTSSCGAAYFANAPSASDYTVTIAKTGYTTTALTNVAVSGETFYGAAFP